MGSNPRSVRPDARSLAVFAARDDKRETGRQRAGRKVFAGKIWNSQTRQLLCAQAAGATRKFDMPEKIRPIEQTLEFSDEESLSPEHLDSQVQRAQDQLLALKRQQEQIEKQKRELE